MNTSSSTNDTISLQAIATTPVAISGEAAYTAAAMLGLEIHQQHSVFRKANATIASSKAPLNISLFPNPAKSNVYISGVYDDTQVIIYDTECKLLSSFVANKTNSFFSVSNLKNGIYFVTIISSKSVYDLKLTVIK